MSKHFAVIICGIIMSAILSSLIFAEEIDMSGRKILFRTEGPRSEKSRLALSEKGDRAVLEFRIFEKGVKDTIYTLYLQGKSDQAPLVYLNDDKIDSSPVIRSDGILIRIPPGILKQYEVNRLEIVNAKYAPLKFDSASMFSLLDTFEEVHFEQAFSEIKVLSQPPKHPNQDKYDALHYDLSLELTMGSRLIKNGRLIFEGKVTAAPFTQLVLDFHPNGGSMDIKQVTSGTVGLSYSIDSSNNWLIIDLPDSLNVDNEFKVSIDYMGYPNTAGVWGAPYRAESHNGTPVIYTFSQPYGARHWWPCKDIPEDKATIDLHITVEGDYMVVTNGKLTGIDSPGEGRYTFHYSETYPIVTYLVSICCTNYKLSRKDYTTPDGSKTMMLGHYLYPENYEAEKNGYIGTLEAMNLYVDLFGEYPFINEKYVTATHNSGSGMEHQTCTSMPEMNLSTEGRHRRNIHELAHMWFGDSVTMHHYDHLWLNEGFATYAEALYHEHYNGDAAFHAFVNGWEGSGVSDTIPLVSSNADRFYMSVVYRRGAWVLHMLRHVVGDDIFFQALRNYYNAHAYGTALTPDLQDQFELLYGKSLQWFFDEWVYGTGRPTYSWGWTSETGAKNLVHLRLLQTQSGDAFTMPVDVKVSDISGNSKIFVVWNDQKEQQFDIDTGNIVPFEVDIDPDNWILNYEDVQEVDPPSLESVEADPENRAITCKWRSTGDLPAGYQLLMSNNYTSWTLAAGTDTLTGSTFSFNIEDLKLRNTYYFRIRAVSENGWLSEMSDLYAVRMNGKSDKVLIVDGNDRWESDDKGPQEWAAWHGKSVAAAGVSFDTCTNESVIAEEVILNDYKAVIWVLGEESTVDHTFDEMERSYVTAYLQAGGQMFITGAEIGWDLDYRENGRSFYNNYLKADFKQDDSSGNYSVTGVVGSIFEGLSFEFGRGKGGTYAITYPDSILPLNESTVNLKYSETLNAGIQYQGAFPDGSSEGKLVYLGFPFETIHEEAYRNEVMLRVLLFFDVVTEGKASGAFLY